MKRLWQRLQLESPGDVQETITLALESTLHKTLERLELEGRLRPGHRSCKLVFPRLYEEVLEVALKEHRRPEFLRVHFLEMMPAMRVEQVGVTAEPDMDFFHRTLDWSRLSRLSEALASFESLLTDHGISTELAWSWPSVTDLQAQVSTLGEWMESLCFGASFPLLYGYPTDLGSYGQEVRDSGDFWEVFDRRFTNPLVHELSHFGRDRAALFPPLLDESLSAYFGFLAHPQIAFPDPGEDNGLLGAAFFTQIGQVFVRNFGLTESLRAHVGVDSFASLLGDDGLAHVERLGWAQLMKSEDVSLLAGHEDPSTWQKIFYLLGAGTRLDGVGLDDIEAMSFSEIDVGIPGPMDREMVYHAIMSMCLRNRLSNSSYRVERRLPQEPIHIDLYSCSVTRRNDPSDAGHRDPVYRFPPQLAASLRGQGMKSLALRLFEWGGVEEAADALFEGRFEGRSDRFELGVIDSHA